MLHRLIETERDAGRADLGSAVSAVDSALGAEALPEVERAWRGQFRGEGGGAASGPELLAEVLVLAALNEDPAATGVRELVDDQPLRDRTPYEKVLEATEQQLGGRSATAPSPAGTRGGRRREAGEANGWRARAGRAAAGTAARADAPRAGLARRAAPLGPPALGLDHPTAIPRSPAGSTSRSTSSPRRRARSS